MPIQPMNFAGIAPQGLPLADALVGGYQQGQNFQQGLQAQKIANAIAQIQQQFAPQMNEANLAYKNALAQREQTLADNPMPGNLIGAAAEVAGLETIKKMYGENSPQYKLATKLINAKQQQQEGRGLGVGAKEETFYQANVARDNPSLTPEQIREASNVYRQGGDKLSDGTPLNPMSEASRSSLDRLIKYGNTTQGLNQQRYAATAETLIGNADQNAIYASQYAGFLRKFNGNIEKAKAEMGGKNSQALQGYNQLVYQDAPAIAGEVMREMGANASDAQKKLYLQIVNPDYWFNNPIQALANWEHFKNMARSVGKTISQSPSQISSALKNRSEQQIDKMIYGDFSLPKFSNSDQFQVWYKQQPPNVKAKVKIMLGGK